MNYILKPKEIFPQVYWDYADAQRYLRLHAKKYGIDPNSFGAIGIFGWWVVDFLGRAQQWWLFSPMGSLEQSLHHHNAIHGYRKNSFPRPFEASVAAYPGSYGKMQAIALDFSSFDNNVNGFTPSTLRMVGLKRDGSDPAEFKHHKEYEEAGVDLSYAVIESNYFKGRNVQPALWEADRTRTRSLDGKTTKTLPAVIADFFDRELRGPQARTPVPEIWPSIRLVDKPTTVSMVVPDKAITIHYTTDGSDPTTASPTYGKPFTIKPDQKVRAMTVMAGRRPSAIVEAHYRAGTPPPTITAPDSQVLPPGTTGKPYSVNFSANRPNVRWQMAGELVPRLVSKKGKSPTMLYPNGMRLHADGRWSGTPIRPGTYWIQVWANDAVGAIAGGRNINGRLPVKILVKGLAATRYCYRYLCRSPGCARFQLVCGDSNAYFRTQGIDAVTQPGAGKKEVIILVPKEHLAKAQDIARTEAQTNRKIQIIRYGR